MEQQKPTPTQSGTKVALGVVIFMVGLVAVLFLLKYLLNM